MDPPDAPQASPSPSIPSARLDRGQVYVWYALLERPAAWWAEARALLSKAETERVSAYGCREKASQFIAARAMLRQVLGWHLEVEPVDIGLDVEPGGKPFLSGPLAHAGVDFNLSHSRDVMLVAVASGRRVGVDVEYRRRHLDVERIARRFFAPQEMAQLLRMPAGDRRTAFYAGWTRKEAYLKARGQGLAGGLRSFAVGLGPEAEPALADGRKDGLWQPCWRLINLVWHPDYAGALCAEGTGWALRAGVWNLVTGLPQR